MNAPVHATRTKSNPATTSLAAKLRAHVEGEVLFDAFSRGRYATDASIYQLDPVGVVVPKNEDAARTAIQIAAEHGVPILPRGAGTSQCGQTVGVALVMLKRQERRDARFGPYTFQVMHRHRTRTDDNRGRDLTPVQ